MARSNRNGPRLFAFLFLAVGIGVVCYAVSSVVSARSFLASAASADGRVLGMVVRFAMQDHQRRTPAIAPRVSFALPDGRTVEFVSGLATIAPHYEVGQRVRVLYAPDDPQHAEIADSVSQQSADLHFALVGAGFVLWGVILLFVRPPAPRTRRTAS